MVSLSKIPYKCHQWVITVRRKWAQAQDGIRSGSTIVLSNRLLPTRKTSTQDLVGYYYNGIRSSAAIYGISLQASAHDKIISGGKTLVVPNPWLDS